MPPLNEVNEVAQQLYEHLSDLDFADNVSVHCDPQVDMSIGNDLYWSFFTGNVKRGESGPVAMESKLGWVLSGPIPKEQTSGVSTNVVFGHTSYFCRTFIKFMGDMR